MAQPAQPFAGRNPLPESKTWTRALPSPSPYTATRSSLPSPVTSPAAIVARPRSYSPSALSYTLLVTTRPFGLGSKTCRRTRAFAYW